MNYKAIGEMGQNCVIGELSKFSLGVAHVLSDNYPFDLIVIAGGKLFRLQVKTSTENKNDEYVSFSLKCNNWHDGTIKKYTQEDCDAFALYDLVQHRCFLLSPKEFVGKGSFIVRYQKAKTTNRYGINWWEDYIISRRRIEEVFGYDIGEIEWNFATDVKEKRARQKRSKKVYDVICLECGRTFQTGHKNAKCCSSHCKAAKSRRVERPSKEDLIDLIKEKSILSIGKSFGVSDNAVRKWARTYEIDIHALKTLN